MKKTPSPFDLLLSVNLYNLRREAKLSRKEAAGRIDVIPQVYSHLEQGTYPFSDEIIDAVCVYYKIERHKFVCLTEDMRRQIINAEEIIKQQDEKIKQQDEKIKMLEAEHKTIFNFLETFKKYIEPFVTQENVLKPYAEFISETEIPKQVRNDET